MGKLLMPATVFRTVANRVSQLSQPRTTLRQCDSCPYPFRDRASTVALSRRGCWRQKRTVANRAARQRRGHVIRHRCYWADSRPKASVERRWGLNPHNTQHSNRTIRSVCTEAKNQRRPIEFNRGHHAQRVEAARVFCVFEFERYCTKRRERAPRPRRKGTVAWGAGFKSSCNTATSNPPYSHAHNFFPSQIYEVQR
jgi:hypothetical protein